MRPILWGIIWFFIGMVGWICFSVILGLAMGLRAEADPLLLALVYLFGMLFFFSLPVTAIAEVIIWIKKRKKPKA